MAKCVKLNSLAQEVRLIDGMYRGDKLVQYELYKYCADYFYEKYTNQGHTHAQPLYFGGFDENGDSLINELSYLIPLFVFIIAILDCRFWRLGQPQLFNMVLGIATCISLCYNFFTEIITIIWKIFISISL